MRTFEILLEFIGMLLLLLMLAYGTHYLLS
jgi:hypothetical protein